MTKPYELLRQKLPKKLLDAAEIKTKKMLEEIRASRNIQLDSTSENSQSSNDENC